MKPGMIKIFTVLTNQRQGLTFTELQKKVNLSSPVLSEYLATMQEQGVIVRDPKSRKYSLAKIYYPLDVFANDYQKSLTLFLASISNQALKISKIENQKERKESFRLFLESSFSFFMLAIWKIIGESIQQLSKRDDLKDQKLILKINNTINNAFHDWIAPMSNALAISVGVNIDIIDVGDQFFEKILKETTQKMSILKKSI